MIRRPPRSTLFPYTDALPIYFIFSARLFVKEKIGRFFIGRIYNPDIRSEEHTSELQPRGLTSYPFFFFNDTATTEIYTLSLHRRSSDLLYLFCPVVCQGKDRAIFYWKDLQPRY